MMSGQWSESGFTERARQALTLAEAEAKRLHHTHVGTEHLLLGLVLEPDGVASRVLHRLGIEAERVRAAIERIVRPGERERVIGDLALTPRAKRVIQFSLEEARRLGQTHAGTEHLLLGLVREGEGTATGILVSLGARAHLVQAQVIEVLSTAARPEPAGPTRALTPAELREFLAGAWNAKVGCLTEDGAPYVVPAWYEWDGRDFWLVAREKSVWATYLRRDPRVCLCIDQEAAPHRRVQVLGRAEIVEEPNVGGGWVPIAERMATRYLGPIDGPKYLVPTLGRPRWLIRVRPSEMKSWAGGEWHRRYRS